MDLKKVLFVLFLTSYVLQFSNSNAQPQNSGIGFDLGIGYSNFSPYESNNSFAIQNDDFKNAATFSVGIHFYLSNKLAIFSRVSYLKSSVKHEQTVTTEANELLAVIEDEFKVSSLPMAFGISYDSAIGKLTLTAELSAEYHFAKQSYEFPGLKERSIPGIKQKEKQTGFGFALAAGPKWKLSSLLTLVGKTGYRFAEISEFEGNNDGFLLKDVTFDFSGVFFEVGVRIDP